MADKVPGATPVPERAILRFGFEPFDVIATLPLDAPATVGANCTANVVLCPGVSVSGRLSPLMLYPLPVANAAEIVRFDPPELVRVSFNDLEFPTVTLPKLWLVGFGVICPRATPVPVSAMFSGELVASETTARLPLTAPATVGANLTENVTVCVGVKVTGSVSPVTEKPAPVTLACEMVTLTPPVLVKVSDRLELLLIWTLPKGKLTGFAESVPAATPVPARAMFSVGLEPSDVIVTLPLAAPSEAGAN